MSHAEITSPIIPLFLQNPLNLHSRCVPGMGALGEVGETLRTSDGSPVPKHRHQQYGAGEDEATCNCSWIVEFFSWKKHREAPLFF